jgi:hypothetical protein
MGYAGPYVRISLSDGHHVDAQGTLEDVRAQVAPGGFVTILDVHGASREINVASIVELKPSPSDWGTGTRSNTQAEDPSITAGLRERPL